MFKSITTFPKYYLVVWHDDRPQVVRRDVYWDNGFKSPAENELIEQIKAQLENGWQA